MSIREIKYNVTSLGVTPASHQWGGVQHEDNATTVSYFIGAEYLAELGDVENLRFRIDFNSPSAGYDPSFNLELNNSVLSRDIPQKMTKYGGNMQSTLVISRINTDNLPETLEEILQIPSTVFFTSATRQDERFNRNLSAYEEYVAKKATEVGISASLADVSADEAKEAASQAEEFAGFAQSQSVYAANSEKIAAEFSAQAVQAADTAQVQVKLIEEKLASGEFKGERGEKGEKGDAGVIKFIPANELPEENIDETAIYLVPAENIDEQNIYEEFVYINGNWESLGTVPVEIDLSDYVKKTQFADYNGNPGILRVKHTYGIGSGRYGSTSPETGDTVCIVKATDYDVKERKQNYRPIVPANLDYAVKMALTDSKIEWTEEEKKAVRNLLGIEENKNEVLLDNYVVEDNVIPNVSIELGQKYLLSVYLTDENNQTLDSVEVVGQEYEQIPDNILVRGLLANCNSYAYGPGIFQLYNVDGGIVGFYFDTTNGYQHYNYKITLIKVNG